MSLETVELAAERRPFSARLSDAADMEAIQPFIDEGLVASVLNVIKSGKEATVYRCRAAPGNGGPFVAAKVYHASAHRNFRDDAAYTSGRAVERDHQARRIAKAIAQRSRVGRAAKAEMWTNYEFDVLCTLFEAGAPVPEPIACEGTALVMEYLGQGDRPAPQLANIELDHEDARAAFEVVLGAIETALRNNLVHADLSAYNILWHRGRPVLIDFPQAIDARFNHNARALLVRDLANICRCFERYGVEADAARLANRLWGGFVRGG